ncbi:MAG TPA: HPF/RaiA family ribosome-associated protein [Solirubrobacterales bacterium]|nr:HPF/RaiA family ribosome-associated protein [Solirubrobacterales bacterium]HNA23866.1 HPF/RaiA family ribosome-associated protein [Solirubrobacterales bacterium]HNC06309.1 HPF/RaiA family ribosome-associated protein [Solirubrobacterales bacterium]HNC94124.1 HPF/RaiA family ribosome-associated protein [Solirubrobacterales bacterium]HNF84841.1 HPF/RaiA family ribosome-associated protein [Solirubrobacterales bacterium]
MNVDVTTRGSVDPEAVELAQEKLTELESAVGRPLSHVRVVLRQEKESIPNAARAEGEAQVGKTIIRGHVAADSMSHAVHELADRLQQQIRRHLDRVTSLKRQPVETPDGKWDHGTWVPARPAQSLLAPGEREVIRRKVLSLVPLKASEAAELMRELDHGFYLFHDSDTEADSVIYLRDDGQLAVIAAQGVAAPADGEDSSGIQRETSHYSSALTLEDAVSQMDELNHRFMFFTDAATDRAAIIYLRYDGNYGLIEQEA